MTLPPRPVTSGLHASFDKGSWALVSLDHQYLDELDKFFDKKGMWRKQPRDDNRMKVRVAFLSCATLFGYQYFLL